MRRAALAAVVVYLVVLSSLIFAQNPKPVDTMPISQIHAGMRGVAYTVFQGTTPEAMEVEVLGVLKNANGPKGDVILIVYSLLLFVDCDYECLKVPGRLLARFRC